MSKYPLVNQTSVDFYTKSEAASVFVAKADMPIRKWLSSVTYMAGDWVTYRGGLYRCKKNGIIGTFRVPNEWEGVMAGWTAVDEDTTVYIYVARTGSAVPASPLTGDPFDSIESAISWLNNSVQANEVIIKCNSVEEVPWESVPKYKTVVESMRNYASVPEVYSLSMPINIPDFNLTIVGTATSPSNKTKIILPWGASYRFDKRIKFKDVIISGLGFDGKSIDTTYVVSGRSTYQGTVFHCLKGLELSGVLVQDFPQTYTAATGRTGQYQSVYQEACFPLFYVVGDVTLQGPITINAPTCTFYVERGVVSSLGTVSINGQMTIKNGCLQLSGNSSNLTVTSSIIDPNPTWVAPAYPNQQVSLETKRAALTLYRSLLTTVEDAGVSKRLTVNSTSGVVGTTALRAAYTDIHVDSKFTLTLNSPQSAAELQYHCTIGNTEPFTIATPQDENINLSGKSMVLYPSVDMSNTLYNNAIVRDLDTNSVIWSPDL